MQTFCKWCKSRVVTEHIHSPLRTVKHFHCKQLPYVKLFGSSWVRPSSKSVICVTISSSYLAITLGNLPKSSKGLLHSIIQINAEAIVALLFRAPIFKNSRALASKALLFHSLFWRPDQNLLLTDLSAPYGRLRKTRWECQQNTLPGRIKFPILMWYAEEGWIHPNRILVAQNTSQYVNSS